ncbi:hypothetical protein JYT28_01075 [Desulfobulbus sp. AH-315-M07]|nr:hypothetical protein [Desulfobulbus sp. AH-315-M07]
MSDEQPEPNLTLTRYADALAHRSIVPDVPPETMMDRLNIDDWRQVNARWSIRLLTGPDSERSRASGNFHAAITRIQKAKGARVRLPRASEKKET